MGGVVGGIAFLVAVALFLFYMRKRHDRLLRDQGSTFRGAGGSEKWGGPGSNAGTITPYTNGAIGPAGSWIPYDEYGRPLVGPFVPPETFPSPPVSGDGGAGTPGSMPTASRGMLPEPVCLHYFLL